MEGPAGQRLPCLGSVVASVVIWRAALAGDRQRGGQADGRAPGRCCGASGTGRRRAAGGVPGRDLARPAGGAGVTVSHNAI